MRRLLRPSLACLVASALGVTGCLGGETRLALVSNELPPTFKLTGSGKNAYLVVHGPFADGNATHSYQEVRTRENTSVWAVTHKELGASVGAFSPVKLGVLPENARQSIGPMPPLQVGKHYIVELNAQPTRFIDGATQIFRYRCFEVQATRVVEESCEHR